MVFPENRENNRESLQISLDSGFSERLLEPIAEPVQKLVANSLVLWKQGIFLPEQGMIHLEQGIASNCGNVGSSFRFVWPKRR
jgi:hypothetical protein